MPALDSHREIMPRKLIVGGMQRTGTLKSSTIKKVAPPVVPELTYRHSGSSFSSGYGSQATVDRNSCGSLGTDEPVSPPPQSPAADSCDYGRLQSNLGNLPMSSPTRPNTTHFCFPDVQGHYTQVLIHAGPGSQPSTPVDSGPPSISMVTGRHTHPSAAQILLEDQGIDVCQSPGRESPGGSSGGSSASGGSRHSTSSVDSGRASGSDAKAGHQHRLSLQSYESVNSSHRHSYHSSSSSLGSVERIEDGGSPASLGINVAEMILHGVQDGEILAAWLTSLRFEEYIPLFLQAGYDMPTISRMTPEDLTAIGITKPNHRRKLKAEIARLNISDGIPDYKPDSLLEWLHLLRLEDYYDSLCHQGYDTIDRVTELTWEDLEEIGIQKLGHQKKIILAIKRVKDITNGIRRSSHIPDPPDLSGNGLVTLPRPTNLGNAPPYSYHSQEIAITTRAKLSPTAETDNMLEFKTFQQSPPKGDGFHHFIKSRELHSPTHMGNLYQPNVLAIQVRATSRGRSLESLDMDDSVSTVMHPTFHNGPDCWYDTVSAWRHHGYDTDSELSVHNDHCLFFETDGTATLHRPKGMVKPRPVAKIVAKTRQSDPEINTEIEEDCKMSLKTATQGVDNWSSPQHSWTNNTGSPQMYGTLRGKRNPPPPPKRTNSIKSDPTVERSLEAMKDEAFATCVKGLTTHFSISTGRVSDLPPPPNNQDRAASPALTEDFPPPPSPLPSAMHDYPDDAGSPNAADIHCAKDSVQSDELHSTPKFRQRRKDSADSNISTSSTESNTLPFANENVGTIKQRTTKTHPTLSIDSSSPIPSPSSTLRKSTISSQAGNSNASPLASVKKREIGYRDNTSNGNCDDMRKSSASSGDVIDDIENMLVNLSHQLDAMLEDEIIGQ